MYSQVYGFVVALGSHWGGFAVLQAKGFRMRTQGTRIHSEGLLPTYARSQPWLRW